MSVFRCDVLSKPGDSTGGHNRARPDAYDHFLLRIILRCPRCSYDWGLAPLASMHCDHLHVLTLRIGRREVVALEQPGQLRNHRFCLRASFAHQRSIVVGRERRQAFSLFARARTGNPRLAASVAAVHLDYFRVLNLTHTQ